ncbi:MAG TPA: uroporphyrinogen-III synthase [Verrucomicrobiae bacterium]|nr:uroporphyrinogen-III synthase [Verrucomicrobiae bacterium]
MSFAGKRVLSLESRRSAETAELIRRNGGDPFVAPSMREVPVEENPAAFEFAQRLFAGEFDMVIFLTGVGTKYLAKLIATRYPNDQFAHALRKITIVARGPKPVAALREMNLPVTISVPEPNTWHEIMAALEGRSERRIAVQEYGRPATELVEALRKIGADVSPVPVYQYGMPENLEPLRTAVTRLADKSFDVTLFTTSQQVPHLMEVAAQMELEPAVHAGLRKSIIASIGPTTSATLREYGLEPDLEPSHPKLGLLVKEAAERSDDLLWKKDR